MKNLFSAKGHLDISNVIHGPYQRIQELSPSPFFFISKNVLLFHYRILFWLRGPSAQEPPKKRNNRAINGSGTQWVSGLVSFVTADWMTNFNCLNFLPEGVLDYLIRERWRPLELECPWWFHSAKVAQFRAVVIDTCHASVHDESIRCIVSHSFWKFFKWKLEDLSQDTWQALGNQGKTLFLKIHVMYTFKHFGWHSSGVGKLRFKSHMWLRK